MAKSHFNRSIRFMELRFAVCFERSFGGHAARSPARFQLIGDKKRSFTVHDFAPKLRTTAPLRAGDWREASVCQTTAGIQVQLSDASGSSRDPLFVQP